MNYSTFIKEINDDYLIIENIHLLEYKRWLVYIDAFKNKISKEDFKRLNLFLFLLEQRIDKSSNYKINDDEIDNYFETLSILIKLPLYKKTCSLEDVNNLLLNNHFDISNNFMVKVNDNIIIKIKNCKVICKLLLMFIKTIKHIDEQIKIRKLISICAEEIDNYTNIKNDCLEVIGTFYYIINNINNSIKIFLGFDTPNTSDTSDTSDTSKTNDSSSEASPHSSSETSPSSSSSKTSHHHSSNKTSCKTSQSPFDFVDKRQMYTYLWK